MSHLHTHLNQIPDMARTYLIFTTTLTLLYFSSCPAQAQTSQSFSSGLCSPSPDLNPGKLTHLHFYFHDILTGAQPTAAVVAESPTTNASATEFGVVVTMDDPLTEGPELSSAPVGRAQGIYASASQSEMAFLMVATFVFTHGEHRGSSLSVLGREPVQDAVRETPVVGGTGGFRFARGYAHVRTHALSFETKNAVTEYDVYVYHY